MGVDRAQTWESFTRNQTRILAHINEADAWSASFWSASRTQEQRQIGWSDSTAISFVEDIVFEKLFYDVKYGLKIKNTAAFPIILTINTNNLPLLSKRFLSRFQASLPSEKGKRKKTRQFQSQWIMHRKREKCSRERHYSRRFPKEIRKGGANVAPRIAPRLVTNVIFRK